MLQASKLETLHQYNTVINYQLEVLASQKLLRTRLELHIYL